MSRVRTRGEAEGRLSNTCNIERDIMRARAVVQPLHPKSVQRSAEEVAEAYSEAGRSYLRYADGDLRSLYGFDSHYAYGDRYLWTLVEDLLGQVRAEGRTELRILDAGCGPGTWLRRIVSRALELGFTHICARGFDLAELQVDLARTLSADLRSRPGVEVDFEVGDLTRPFAEADVSVDLCLCLYGVLNHLSPAVLPAVVAEFARVTGGVFVTTVRSAGSEPSIFVGAMDEARRIHQDNDADRCEIELQDGRRLSLPCHLFTARELWRLFSAGFEVEDLRGLDLFHCRFAPDPHWNPDFLQADDLQDELKRLEEDFAHRPGFVDRAAHLLLVGRPGGR